MVNKEWLIKIEDDIYYDSEEKVYRYRMHCPLCKKVSGCLCYRELDDAFMDKEERINYACSCKHSVLLMKDSSDITDMLAFLEIDINNITEKKAQSLLDMLVEDSSCDDYTVVGDDCKT